MNMTVQDLLTDALGVINATAISETPSAADLDVALRAANAMIDFWSSQRLLLRSTTLVSFTLTPAKYIYTIGSNASLDINQSKPLKIQSAYYTDVVADADYPLDVIPKEMFDQLVDKNTTTGRPMYLAYSPNSAQQTLNTGTIYVYYAPDQAYVVHMECDLYLTELGALADQVTFEPIYYEPLIYNLGLRLFRRFHSKDAQIPVDIIRIANEGLDGLRAMNTTTLNAGMEVPGGKITNYNIYTDSYN